VVSSRGRPGRRAGSRQVLPLLYKESIEWLRLGAGQGVALAQNGLGVIYAQGLGVPEDIKEAAKWWQLAADQGDADAQASLGYLYESGSGLMQDYVQAHLWYSLVIAAYPTNVSAIQGLQAISRKMTPAQLAEAQSLEQNWKPK
jgi:TPR repeat protein